MSGLFGSTLIKGNRITEFSDTTATVGTVIPFGYGRFTSGGNVIWAPLPPKEQRHVKRQGKGGVKQESFTYTLSYAIAFAKGPIFGYWWIKRNGKVVWTQDPNAPIEDQEYAAKWAERATFYYGTMSQLPDSTIESYEGSGQVSAFHRLAYLVVEDDDVTDGGGAVPTYEACVIASPPDIYVTSKPYPVLEVSAAQVAARPSGGLLRTILHERETVDAAGASVAPITGELRDVYIRRRLPDAAGASVAPVGGNLKTAMVTALMQQSAAGASVAPVGGQLKPALIAGRIPAESVSTTVAPIGGQLS